MCVEQANLFVLCPYLCRRQHDWILEKMNSAVYRGQTDMWLAPPMPTTTSLPHVLHMSCNCKLLLQ
jgi:hypothetical protein